MNNQTMQLLQDLVQSFDPTAATGLTADIQFIFTGSEKGVYYLRIANGKCSLHAGELDFARLTIRVDIDTWRQIQNGQIGWGEALMQRKFLATGNFPLLARLPELFRLLSTGAKNA